MSVMVGKSIHLDMATINKTQSCASVKVKVYLDAKLPEYVG